MVGGPSRSAQDTDGWAVAERLPGQRPPHRHASPGRNEELDHSISMDFRPLTPHTRRGRAAANDPPPLSLLPLLSFFPISRCPLSPPLPPPHFRHCPDSVVCVHVTGGVFAHLQAGSRPIVAPGPTHALGDAVPRPQCLGRLSARGRAPQRRARRQSRPVPHNLRVPLRPPPSPWRSPFLAPCRSSWAALLGRPLSRRPSSCWARPRVRVAGGPRVCPPAPGALRPLSLCPGAALFPASPRRRGSFRLRSPAAVARARRAPFVRRLSAVLSARASLRACRRPAGCVRGRFPRGSVWPCSRRPVSGCSRPAARARSRRAGRSPRPPPWLGSPAGGVAGRVRRSPPAPRAASSCVAAPPGAAPRSAFSRVRPARARPASPLRGRSAPPRRPAGALRRSSSAPPGPPAPARGPPRAARARGGPRAAGRPPRPPPPRPPRPRAAAPPDPEYRLFSA